MDDRLGNREIFATNLKRKLEMRGVTMMDLSRSTGIPYNTIVNWSLSKTYPRIDALEKVARYFGCEKSELIEEPGSSNPELADKLFRHQPELKELYYTAKGMSPADLKLAIQLIRTVRQEADRRIKEDDYGRSVLSERKEV